MDETMGEYVDRAVNIEMRYGGGLPRGVTHQLYDAARAKQGAPLTWLAAKALHDKVRPGDHVLVVTGAGSWPWLPNGETDAHSAPPPSRTRWRRPWAPNPSWSPRSATWARSWPPRRRSGS